MEKGITRSRWSIWAYLQHELLQAGLAADKVTMIINTCREHDWTVSQLDALVMVLRTIADVLRLEQHHD